MADVGVDEVVDTLGKRKAMAQKAVRAISSTCSDRALTRFGARHFKRS